MPVPVCLSGPCRAPPRRRCSSARPHHRLPGPYRSSDRATPRFTFLSAFASSSLARVSPRLVSPRFASPRLAAPRRASPHRHSPQLASPRFDSPRTAFALPRRAGSHAYILILSSFSAVQLVSSLVSIFSAFRFVSFLNPLVPFDQYRSRYLANKFQVTHADDF